MSVLIAAMSLEEPDIPEHTDEAPRNIDLDPVGPWTRDKPSGQCVGEERQGICSREMRSPALHGFPIALNREVVEQGIGPTREQEEHFRKSLVW